MAYFKVSKGFSKEPSVRALLSHLEDYYSGYILPPDSPGIPGIDGTFVFMFDFFKFGQHEEVTVTGNTVTGNAITYNIRGNSDGADFNVLYNSNKGEITSEPHSVFGTNTPMSFIEGLGFRILEGETNSTRITFVGEARNIKPFYMTKAIFWIQKGLGVDAYISGTAPVMFTIVIRSGLEFRPLEDREEADRPDSPLFGNVLGGDSGILNLTKEDIEKSVPSSREIAEMSETLKRSVPHSVVSFPRLEPISIPPIGEGMTATVRELRETMTKAAHSKPVVTTTVEVKVDDLMDAFQQTIFEYEKEYYQRPYGVVCSIETYHAFQYLIKEMASMAVRESLLPSSHLKGLIFMGIRIHPSRKKTFPMSTFIPFEE